MNFIPKDELEFTIRKTKGNISKALQCAVTDLLSQAYDYCVPDENDQAKWGKISDKEKAEKRKDHFCNRLADLLLDDNLYDMCRYFELGVRLNNFASIKDYLDHGDWRGTGTTYPDTNFCFKSKFEDDAEMLTVKTPNGVKLFESLCDSLIGN